LNPRPIITFDSPFTGENTHLSGSYIGVDNLQFGLALAMLAKRLKPGGGQVCIMSAARNVNLQLRVLGIRLELSGDYARKAGRCEGVLILPILGPHPESQPQDLYLQTHA